MLVKASITFDGKAEEALNFYKSIFNGKVANLLRFGDVKNNPQTDSLPEEYKKRIMNARLDFGNNMFNACDSLPNNKVVAGNNIALDIVVFDDKDIKRIFDQLSVDGQIIMPLTTTFFSPNYGKLIDKFGIHWDFMQMHEE